MRPRILLALSLASLVAWLPALPAAAGPPTGPGPAPDHPGWKDRKDHRWTDHGRRKIIVVPQPVWVAPNRCWVSGGWSYVWVPQVHAYSVWVPGHWSPEGTWVEGHYEQRFYTTGSWQPYWTEGRWTPC